MEGKCSRNGRRDTRLKQLVGKHFFLGQNVAHNVPFPDTPRLFHAPIYDIKPLSISTYISQISPDKTVKARSRYKGKDGGETPRHIRH